MNEQQRISSLATNDDWRVVERMKGGQLLLKAQVFFRVLSFSECETFVFVT